MSTNTPLPDPGNDVRDLSVLRDVLALLIVAAGLAGLTAAAFMWCEPAGYAVVSLAVIAAGVALGTRRDTDSL